ncbi:hypothetical protein OIU74_010405 [Salix koriyanagi]|uniref:Uncharacterized protein n=1 Tax=Salix koriyanagi TaxID=2511006 RepID=A0A9Q0TCV4_9ROSI|nr:hypothetical protein OIU74_010405 [Salix koriyanagi]
MSAEKTIKDYPGKQSLLRVDRKLPLIRKLRVMWNEGNFEVEISILQAEQWKISECAGAIWMEKSRQNGRCKLGDKNTQFVHLNGSGQEWGRPEGLKTLSSLQIRELQQDITMDEVRQAVRDCDGSKAPSPDGFTFTFYKKALLLTGMVSGFFKNGKLPNGINTTNVKLVLHKFSDCRSLSLVRGLYKIVGKVLSSG